jgi:hypothetical protein
VIQANGRWDASSKPHVISDTAEVIGPSNLTYSGQNAL